MTGEAVDEDPRPGCLRGLLGMVLLVAFGVGIVLFLQSDAYLDISEWISDWWISQAPGQPD